MKANVTQVMVDEHQLILRMITLVEQNTALLEEGEFRNWQFYLDAVDFIRNFADRFHHSKEEDVLFSELVKNGMPEKQSPIEAMHMEHDQGRAHVRAMEEAAQRAIDGETGQATIIAEQAKGYAELLRGHIEKENDILYPLAQRVMSAADDATVLAGIDSAEAAVGPDTHAKYYAIADEILSAGEVKDLAHGLDLDTFGAILNTLPVELSFVDADDTVKYFSHENLPKIFPRTRGAIGTKVQQCHPQKSVHLVNQILADFKAGTRDVAEFWIDMGDKKVHIRYFPVLSPKGDYLGCLETVQDIAPIQAIEGQRRLLDES